MKKILILVLLVLFCSGSAFGGEFEDTLKKAEQGDATAQVNIASIYYQGEGVKQDYKKAFYWIKKAAEQGNASAQFNLGFLYSQGKGVPQDYNKALYWYQKAAEKGNASAQFNLAGMYSDGEGVTQNFKKAYIWESLAAAQGHKSAAKNRDITAKKLTPEQLSEAQELAAQMQEKIDSSKTP